MVFNFKFKGNEFMPQTQIFIYYIFATRCRRALILKYQKFKPSGWKDIGICIFDKSDNVNEFFVTFKSYNCF